MSKLDNQLDLYKDLPRNKYIEKNNELASQLWDNEVLPTVADIADFIEGNKDNHNMNSIFNFFDNEDDFIKMATRTTSDYSQEESSAFVQKVMSANISDIADAGYFYKLLMASADDFRISGKDCRSKGTSYNINEIDESIYKYRIFNMFVTEMDTYSSMTFSDFMNWANNHNIEKIHVHNPLSCNYSHNHKLCRKCAGKLPPRTQNIGAFTTLMVTEHVTQSALSSMNKNKGDNINKVLNRPYPGKNNWISIREWISEIVDFLQNDKVQSRFYEIAMLSRIREDEDGTPGVYNLKTSINYSNNYLGAFYFSPSIKNFKRIIQEGDFNDSSLKVQISINDYNRSDI